MWTIFKVAIELATTLPLFLMFWFFGPKACRSPAPLPGTECTPSALEGEVLTTGPPGKSLPLCLKTRKAELVSTPGMEASPAAQMVKKVKVKVTQFCPTLCDPYTVHGILQVRTLEWVAFPFSRGSSQPRDQAQVSSIIGGFFTSLATKEHVCNAGDLGSIPGSGTSPGERNGHPFQYFYLVNFVDRGAWQATVHGVAKSWTQLSN